MSEIIKKCTFYFPESLYERLRLEAFQTRESQTAIVIEALEKYFQEKDKPGE
jgi:predicted DNA-binding protein